MVTAASSADVAIVLVDVRHGLVEQTRRHLFVTRLLGVRSVAVVVNKMDQVHYDHAAFAAARDAVAAYLAGLDLPGAPPDVAVFPVSALVGDNVVDPSSATPWYDGPTLLSHLERLPVAEERADAPARFVVQWVIRPQSDAHPDYRGYAGRVLSGALRPGDAVRAWPSGQRSSIARVETWDGELSVAGAGSCVVLHLAHELDVARGEWLTLASEPAPTVTREFDADLAWVHADAMRPGHAYVVKHGTREVRAVVDALVHSYDVGTGAREPPGAKPVALNDIARVRVRTTEPIALDRYADLRETGSFLLLDPASGATLAAGMVR